MNTTPNTISTAATLPVVNAETFPALFVARFPSVALYWQYEDYRDRGEYDDEPCYSRVPAPAPKGHYLPAIDIPDWLEEHCFQYAESHGYAGEADPYRVLILAATDVNALAALVQQFANTEAEWGHYVVESEAQQKSRRMLHQMHALEPLAVGIAAKHSVRVGTLEFIDALTAEVADQRQAEADRRYGLQEDGLCIGYGVSCEQWSDEFHSPLYALVEAEAVLEWVQEFRPLLYSTWQESRGHGIPSAK